MHYSELEPGNLYKVVFLHDDLGFDKHGRFCWVDLPDTKPSDREQYFLLVYLDDRLNMRVPGDIPVSQQCVTVWYITEYLVFKKDLFASRVISDCG